MRFRLVVGPRMTNVPERSLRLWRLILFFGPPTERPIKALRSSRSSIHTVLVGVASKCVASYSGVDYGISSLACGDLSVVTWNNQDNLCSLSVFARTFFRPTVLQPERVPPSSNMGAGRNDQVCKPSKLYYSLGLACASTTHIVFSHMRMATKRFSLTNK